MGDKKTTAERGKYKETIQTALYHSPEIRELLLGDTSTMNASETRKLFKERVFSHLFIDDTIEETATFIFYDVVIPQTHPHIKDCRIIMYLITHRDTIDDYSKENYYGNKIDVLSQMVEDALINNKDVARDFGIGELSLDSLDVYNSRRFYGCIMTFSVPNFR